MQVIPPTEFNLYHFIEIIILALISGLVGVMTYIFKQHTKKDDNTSNTLQQHFRDCGEKSLQFAKLLTRLEESVDAKHEENRNTTSALNQAMVRLTEKLDCNSEDIAFIRGHLTLKK